MIGEQEVTQSDLNKFTSVIATANGQKVGQEVPEIEVPRRVIDYFNKGKMKGFDTVGYFLFNGVKVYEKGKREEYKLKENKTMEQLLHGGT